VTFIEDLPEEDRFAARAEFPAGLVNLGNTCYMNASLQALHALPELHDSLQSFRATTNDAASNITTALKSLFADLSATHAAQTPAELLLLVRSAFPQFAEQRSGVYMQQDADEFYTALLTQLRKLPPLPQGPKAINIVEQLFAVRTRVRHTCLEAEASNEPPSESEERVERLQCYIRGGSTNPKENTNHLAEGLSAALDEEVEKESASLHRSAHYRKTTRLLSLPYFLTVQFVRFFWRKEIKAKTKIVRPVEFPFTLDVYNYCTPEVQRELQPQRDAGNLEREPLRNRTGVYELCAIVSHQGRSADGGHYVGWVRRSGGSEDEWLEFDDDKVTSRSKQEIVALSGKGGGDWHIAYLLLYRTRSNSANK
jgi:ubiquitin carboxyl-terminal hydrolase 14